MTEKQYLISRKLNVLDFADQMKKSQRPVVASEFHDNVSTILRTLSPKKALRD